MGQHCKVPASLDNPRSREGERALFDPFGERERRPGVPGVPYELASPLQPPSLPSSVGNTSLLSNTPPLARPLSGDLLAVALPCRRGLGGEAIFSDGGTGLTIDVGMGTTNHKTLCLQMVYSLSLNVHARSNPPPRITWRSAIDPLRCSSSLQNR